MGDWEILGRPGAIGSRKQEVERNWKSLYGQTTIRWRVGDEYVNHPTALLMYENAYYEYFLKNPSELEWILGTYADVYDNNVSNVHSGFDYNKQEFGGNHYQDIAIRRVAARMDKKFTGTGLLEIRTTGVGAKWSPAQVPFHRPEWIPRPEVEGWWQQKGVKDSIEAWYQSAKYLFAQDIRADVKEAMHADIIFATTNKEKLASAQRALSQFSVAGLKLDIAEGQGTIEDVARHKARVAYASLCHPILCDDSGFFIESLSGWPGPYFADTIRGPALWHARSIAAQNNTSSSQPPREDISIYKVLTEDGPVRADFSEALGYHDEYLKRPELFVARVPGALINEERGSYPVKSPQGRIFVPDESNGKTVAELPPGERPQSSQERYKRFASFFMMHHATRGQPARQR